MAPSWVLMSTEVNSDLLLFAMLTAVMIWVGVTVLAVPVVAIEAFCTFTLMSVAMVLAARSTLSLPSASTTTGSYNLEGFLPIRRLEDMVHNVG